jgi:hypothetical protein
MSSFNKILSNIQNEDAEEAANRLIGTAHRAADQAIRVQKARAHFEDAGVHRFLVEQEKAMLAEGFYACYYKDGVDDRASASIGFVPCVGEELIDHHSFGRLNEYRLIIQSHGESVSCSLSSRVHREDYERNLPIGDFSLEHVQHWFERFVREAFEDRKQDDRQKARLR